MEKQTVLNKLKINCNIEEITYFSFFDRNFVITVPAKYFNKNKLNFPLINFLPNHANDKFGNEYNFKNEVVTISGRL